MPEAMTVKLTVTDNAGNFATSSPGVAVSGRNATISPPSGTTAVDVTVTPGAGVTFTDVLHLGFDPQTSGSSRNVALSNGEYVIAHSDQGQGHTVTVDYNQTLTILGQLTTLPDPSMIFNPPG